MWNHGMDAMSPETAGFMLMWLQMVQGENVSMELQPDSWCFLNPPVCDSISLSLTTSS